MLNWFYYILGALNVERVRLISRDFPSRLASFKINENPGHNKKTGHPNSVPVFADAHVCHAIHVTCPCMDLRVSFLQDISGVTKNHLLLCRGDSVNALLEAGRPTGEPLLCSQGARVGGVVTSK